MEFTLKFCGDLKSNACKEDKHTIRKEFHIQIKELWNNQLLMKNADLKSDLIKNIGNFNFLPLISEKIAIIAEIDILMRQGMPDKIITEGGDIDSRLKTIFNALRVPDNKEALPKINRPDNGEDPFFCLLEDDNLITKVTMSTDRLLLPHPSSAHVEMFINVKTIKHIDYIATNGL